MRLPRKPTVLHPSITEDRVLAACMRRMNTLDNPGFCISCGAPQEGCDPDTEKARCETCNKMEVYGSDQLVIMGMYHKKEA